MMSETDSGNHLMSQMTDLALEQVGLFCVDACDLFDVTVIEEDDGISSTSSSSSSTPIRWYVELL